MGPFRVEDSVASPQRRPEKKPERPNFNAAGTEAERKKNREEMERYQKECERIDSLNASIIRDWGDMQCKICLRNGKTCLAEYIAKLNPAVDFDDRAVFTRSLP